MSNIAKDFFENEQSIHTKAKLNMLEKYVIPWMRKVVLSQYGSHSCGIIDTFAGAGKHKDGSEGSPLILLKDAIDFIEQGRKNSFNIRKILLTFIEKDQNNFILLKQNVEDILGEKLVDGKVDQSSKYPQLHIAIENGTHEEFIKQLINDVDRIIPTLFFMDPFGFNIPFELNKAILTKYSNVELLINFMYEEINRFIAYDGVEEKMKKLYGTEDILEIVHQIKDQGAESRRSIIKGAYIENLKKCGAKYTLAFDIRSERGQVKMSMIHVTKNKKGFDQMKDVLEKISNSKEFEYVPTDETEEQDNEEQLQMYEFGDEFEKIKELAQYLYNNISKREIEVKEIIELAMEHPIIPSTYTKKALNKLLDDGKIKKIYRKDGRKVKSNCFPNDAYVEFI